MQKVPSSLKKRKRRVSKTSPVLSQLFCTLHKHFSMSFFSLLYLFICPIKVPVIWNVISFRKLSQSCFVDPLPPQRH